MESLPVMVADSIPFLTIHHMLSAAERIEQKFYRAVASRAVSELEKSRDDEPTDIPDNLREILSRCGMN